MALSTDRRTAVSGGDRTVRVWDLAGGQEQAGANGPGVAFNAAIAAAGNTAGQVHALLLNMPTKAPFRRC